MWKRKTIILYADKKLFKLFTLIYSVPTYFQYIGLGKLAKWFSTLKQMQELKLNHVWIPYNADSFRPPILSVPMNLWQEYPIPYKLGTKPASYICTFSIGLYIVMQLHTTFTTYIDTYNYISYHTTISTMPGIYGPVISYQTLSGLHGSLSVRVARARRGGGGITPLFLPVWCVRVVRVYLFTLFILGVKVWSS
jgi:hypothetical protein